MWSYLDLLWKLFSVSIYLSVANLDPVCLKQGLSVVDVYRVHPALAFIAVWSPEMLQEKN